MSFEFSKEVKDGENSYVIELLSKAMQRMECAVENIQEACQIGGRLSANDAFRLSGQMLHIKNALAVTRDIYDSIQPEPPAPTLDEDGEVMKF